MKEDLELAINHLIKAELLLKNVGRADAKLNEWFIQDITESIKTNRERVGYLFKSLITKEKEENHERNRRP